MNARTQQVLEDDANEREYDLWAAAQYARRPIVGGCAATILGDGRTPCPCPVMDNDPINLFCVDHSMKAYEAMLEREQEARAFLSDPDFLR